jgi:hypothetical protein
MCPWDELPQHGLSQFSFLFGVLRYLKGQSFYTASEDKRLPKDYDVQYMLKLTPARRNNRLTTVHRIDMKYKYFREFEAMFVKDLLRN